MNSEIQGLKETLPGLNQESRIELFFDWFDNFRMYPTRDNLEIVDFIRNYVEIQSTTGINPKEFSIWGDKK